MSTTSEPSEPTTLQRLADLLPPGEPLPEVVEELAQAIDRGRSLAVIAGEGAHLCRLYAATALRDLSGGDHRALVLVATPDRARRLARAIHAIVARAGLTTVVWPEAGERRPAAMIVGTPVDLLTGLRAGGLGGVDPALVILDDVRALAAQWPAVDAILPSVPPTARRVAATHEYDGEFERFLTHQLSRARRWPEELFPNPGEERARDGAKIRFRAGAAGSYEKRLERLVSLVRHWRSSEDSPVTVWCTEPGRIASVQSALAVEGLGPEAVRVGSLSASHEPETESSKGGEPADPEGAAERAGSVIFGLPSRASELERALAAGPRRAAIVEPRHLRQLELLGLRLGWTPVPLGDRREAFHDEISGFRDRVSRAAGSEDLASASLLLDPLIEELGYPRVAAALAAIVRRAGPEPPRDIAAQETPRSPESVDAKRAAAPAWTRIFLNVGRQDEVTPGDLVGAITGETPAAGAQIGRIDIRQRFTLIEIDSMVVEDVIRSLEGKRIKGRDVSVRRDRGR